MSYIFRLYNDGIDSISDWGVSIKIGSSIIDQIQDPNGESAQREITSIPSPFARIDLIKTAFKKVTETGLDGNCFYHKMVSDCLDIGQIFFDFDKFKDKLEIIVWDKTDDLNALLNSPYSEHQQLGDTYQTYLIQDGAVYNFDKMERMYFLNYKSGPSEMNIIGATSPATLFFSSANDLGYVGEELRFGNDHPFDNDFKPLYKRDFEYQKFWYSLRKSIPAFARLFPELDKYLVANLQKLDQSQRNLINAITSSDYQTYSQISVGESNSHAVNILDGIELRRRVQNTSNISHISGFVIQSDKQIGGFSPLVLPIFNYTHKTIYTLDYWDKNTIVPFYDSRLILDRTLPGDGSKYPYLTIGDLFTDTIVRMPNEIDDNNFFNGNLDRPNGNSFLLPLTTTFFHFFNVKDLVEKVMSDNKKMFELEDKATGVTAILRVPIRNGYIEYRRTYFEASVDVLETKNTNDGVLIDKTFGLGVLPLVRFPDKVQKHYRIALFDRGANDICLSFEDGEKTVKYSKVVRSQKEGIICSNEAYIVEDNFDRIHVRIGNLTEGYLVPLFKTKQGNTNYTFAIDFGTTNTHIEYCTNLNLNPVAFNICNNDRQLNKLHKAYTDHVIRLGFEHNFVPDFVGDDELYSFPMRTAYSHHKNVDYSQSPMPLADGNIPFRYEKDKTPEYNETKTDLKWADVPERLLEMHLETIFILMRNKVILNGGNLSSTKVVWFYPASMTEAKVNKFKKYWKSAYKKYFGDDIINNVISISESTAPYSYYSLKLGAKTDVVTIDVGGGTTDVFVVEKRIPSMLLSFRYASNAIFGDGYNWDSDNNGFVSLYKDVYEMMLKNNNHLELKEAFDQIERQKKSSDIVAFLFSLTGSKVRNNPSLDFLNLLTGNDKIRYVFIIFYASIFYFIAKSMKSIGLRKPLTLAFSGNGSHSLRIVSDEKDMIARFAGLIFDGVYGDGLKGKLQVIMEENPKKATCKGGILIPVSQDYDTINSIKTILIGDNLSVYSDQQLIYSDVTPEIEIAVVDEVMSFFEFLFEMHKNNNDFLISKLGADPSIYSTVKEICLDKTTLHQSLLDGIYHKRQEVNNDTKVEETLFFYPLVGVLHELALKISAL